MKVRRGEQWVMKWAASVENWGELSERSLRGGSVLRYILREKEREEGERK